METPGGVMEKVELALEGGVVRMKGTQLVTERSNTGKGRTEVVLGKRESQVNFVATWIR